MIPDLHFKLITFFIVTGTLITGICIPNIEFVLALTGATTGSMICYIFPALLFLNLVSLGKSPSKPLAQFVLFLGVTILLASTYTTLYGAPSSDVVEPGKIKVAPKPVWPDNPILDRDYKEGK